MGFGISFLGDDPKNGNGEQDRFQEAVRVLTLRLPRVVGGSALAPAPLLHGQGASGSPFLQQALAQMAGLPPQGPPQGPMGPTAPTLPTGPMRPAPRAPIPTPRIGVGVDTPGVPIPEGAVAREWAPPPQPDTSTPAPHTGDPAAAAERSSAGYNSDPLSQFQEMFRRKDPWRPGLPI
jgi:hypothetical protein